jgi:DNA-binding NarL/FixJ family response regulator
VATPRKIPLRRGGRPRHANLDRIALQAALDFQGATTLAELAEAVVSATMRVSPGELLYIQAFHSTRGKVDALAPNIEWPFDRHEQEACARLFLRHPLARSFPKMGFVPYTVSDVVPTRCWREEPIYREVFARNRFTHQQTIAVHAEAETNYAVVAMRSGTEFSPRENEGLDRIRWQLMPSIRRVLRMERLRAERRLLESAVAQSNVALLALDGEGRLARMNAAAVRLLRTHDPRGFPRDIPAAVQARRVLQPASDAWTVSTPFGTLRFRMAPALAADETLFFVEEIERREPDGRFLALGLSSRQDAVLHWLSRGKPDREIASLLGIGLRTVHEYVRRIFATLGVENRHAAARVAQEVRPAAADDESIGPAFFEYPP